MMEISTFIHIMGFDSSQICTSL